MNDEEADELRLERRRQDEARQDEAREEHQLDELLDAQARRDADAALGRTFREAFGDDVSVEDMKHLRTVIQCAAPLYWVANDDMDDAKKWEILAHQVLARLRRPDAH